MNDMAGAHGDSEWRERELERMTDEDEDTYEVVRFRFQQASEVIKTGLTLEEAQEHCNDDSTHGQGWFDGYRKEG